MKGDKTVALQDLMELMAGDQMAKDERVPVVEARISALEVKVLPQRLVEQLTEADAEEGVVTFSDVVDILEIINTDETNDGTFTVNGFDVIVPASGIVKQAFGGTAAAAVEIAGSTSYYLNRFKS